jgi:hypothetical protein
VALKKIFQSVPIPYRTPAQRFGVPDGYGEGALYNSWLITPPRLYSERLVPALGCQAFWVTRETLIDSYTVLNMLLWGDAIYWPGWETVKQTFDATSGTALATIDYTLNLPVVVGPTWIAYTSSVTAAFDGTLWRNERGLALTEIDPVSFLPVRGPYNYTSYAGLVGFGLSIVDPANDILITASYGTLNEILVYRLTEGGAPIASFYLPGNEVNICPVGDTSTSTLFYVLTTDNILCLCDYSTGSVVSEYLLPPEVSAGATKINLAWDPVRNLLLVFSQVPDNVDGSSASVVRGYYPVPNPERLTVPIPLLPPRQYKPTPVAARLLGDFGHPVSGVNVTATIVSTTPAAGATMTRPTCPTNASGYATVMFTPTLSCTVDFEVDATV